MGKTLIGFLRRQWRWLLATVVAVCVAVAVVVAMFVIGPWRPATSEQPLADQAVQMYTEFMDQWVPDQANDWSVMPSFYDTYTTGAALSYAKVAHGYYLDHYGTGSSAVASGVPYFAVTRWEPLSDPVRHADALFGMTVCWVEGNITLTYRDVPNGQPYISGPGPSANVAQVYFKNATWKGRTGLFIYDIIDRTYLNQCPLG